MTSTQFTSRDNFLWTLVTASAPIVWGTTYVVTSQLLPAGFPFWSSVLRALPGGILGLLICRSLPKGVWIIRSVILLDHPISNTFRVEHRHLVSALVLGRVSTSRRNCVCASRLSASLRDHLRMATHSTESHLLAHWLGGMRSFWNCNNGPRSRS